MRTGRFHEALESVQKACEMLETSREAYGDDIHIVESKFNMLISNVHFILGNHKASLDAAVKGL
jgi:hypothetical protein